MKAVEFEGQTAVLKPPQGWENSDGALQCGVLPIQIVKDHGLPVMRSFWRPSPDDLAALNAGAHVCLGIIGEAHPPVMVSVEKCEEMP